MGSAAAQVYIKKQWKPITARRRFNFKLNFKLNFLPFVSQCLPLLSYSLSLGHTLHLQVSLPRRLSAGGGRGAGVHASVSQLKEKKTSMNANICIYIINAFPTFSSKITYSLKQYCFISHKNTQYVYLIETFIQCIVFILKMPFLLTYLPYVAKMLKWHSVDVFAIFTI